MDEFVEKKRFPWFTVIGSLVFLGILGSCTWFFVGLFQNAAEVQLLDDAFLASAFDNGLPDADSDIYASNSGVNAEAIASVNTMIDNMGGLRQLSDAGCTATSSASTNAGSGNFVACARTAFFSVTSAAVSTTWRRENEAWKLFALNFNIADIGAYTDAVAEKATSEVTEQGAGQPTE
ncbi:MAG: hypothetical protein AAFV54_10420 [Pseudomonadota bacterium]